MTWFGGWFGETRDQGQSEVIVGEALTVEVVAEGEIEVEIVS